MNEEIKSILGKSIKVNDKNIPVEHLRYKGKSKTFVTWTLLPETPGLNGDDETLYSVAQVDIDIFSDGNYLDIMKEVKKIMKENEWLWLEDSEEMYEDDTDLYHRTITFEKERFLDNG